MMILGIETTSLSGSVALVEDGVIINELVFEKNLKHSRFIVPGIERILNVCGKKLSDISAIAVGTGPGSFTGIRVGLSIAKGLAVEGETKIIGVPSMENMASKINSEEDIYVLIFAHRQEFFIQKYKRKTDYNFVAESECFILKQDEAETFFYDKKCHICSYDIDRLDKEKLKSKIVSYPVYPTAGYAGMIAFKKYLSEHEMSVAPMYVNRIGAEEKGAKVYKF